ncbi:MAG: DUF2845 domain-containing protein [Myxococcales bacterium]|nr:DUF2845 domain-containing protein [Myxococcales bacterium]
MTKPILFTALVALVSLAAAPSEAMTCRNRIVHEGDASARVLELCGDPAEIVQRTVSRSRTIQRQLPDGTVIADTITVTVAVEDWTYDFGPQRFMQRLTFEEGTLVSIETLSYGTPGHHPRKAALKYRS